MILEITSASVFPYNTYLRGDSLKRIICNVSEPPSVIFELATSQYKEIKVIVPDGSLQLYKENKEWGKFWDMHTSAIEPIAKDESEHKSIIGQYDISGRPVTDGYKGLVIIRYSDGSSKKILRQ